MTAKDSSPVELLGELAKLGVRLAATGDRLRFVPRALVTPDLAERMRIHKSELLAMLKTGQCETTPPIFSAPTFGVVVAISPDGQPVDCIDMPDQTPCTRCGTLELWQSMTGEWHCERCDPPAANAIAFMERGERIRNRANSVQNTTCA